MQTQNPFLSKTLNASLAIFQFPIPLRKTLTPIRISPQNPQPIHIQCLSQNPNRSFHRQNLPRRRDVRSSAGRSRKSPDGPSTGRIEGNAQLRREAKRNARKRSRRLAENLFYRLKNPHKNYPDNFSEEELQMIGLGYDRMVRFMEKDDPNLRHPYDWFKYGEFGPYSWRGVVLGEPIRGRLSDECVTMIGEVRDHEEWERIEQFEMAQDFGKRLNSLDKSVGLKYFWVFVRHPKWRVSDLPWQQWTLVCEVVLEAGNQRLDKWNLMGRLGNKARALITQCAAWMRPDVIYVKRPVYQCRFEPQDEFFRALTPLLDPETEQDFLFELELGSEGDGNGGRVELCTYFGGLCKIVKVNPKAFVDDVVKGFEKLNDEGKSKCLEFLLVNHPVPLLHPYTKEWKAKLEELELGCDAPDDDDDDYHGASGGETGFMDWMEDDDEDDVLMDADMEADGDGKLGMNEEEEEEEGNENHWNEEFRKALSSNEAMEGIAKRSVEMSTKMYKKQLRTMEENGESPASEDGDELAIRGTRAKVSPKEWKVVGYGPFRKRIKKSRIPPELFLRAAVRPFTYRNLVKEIVLTRHAIVEGEISGKK